MDTRIEALRQKLSGIPACPGVYLHHDAKGKVLYVGKARNLQNRLHSYFYGLDRQTPKTQALVARIVDFEIVVTENEHESLVLENNLIKFHKPPYNILLRDDKTYPFLRIHTDDTWPRLGRTRRRKNDGALYFGPYTSGTQLMHIMSVIERVFPLVKCSQSVFNNAKRPCNYYHIKQCLGPCALPVDHDEYMGHVHSVIAILNGKTADLRGSLEKSMVLASDNLDFEKAARFRDQIRALEELSGQRQSVHLDDDLNVDFVGTHWQKDAVCFYVATMRSGRLLNGEHFVVERNAELPPQTNDVGEALVSSVAGWRSEAVESFFCQYYLKKKRPPWIVAPAIGEFLDAPQIEILHRFLKNLESDVGGARFILATNLHSKQSSDLISRRKGLLKSFRSLCQTADETALERFKDWIRTDQSSREALKRLAEMLGLENLPVWMECFDISTFQGSETVASQVVFRDGKAAKGDYRRYVIRGVDGQDDFASLREVMRRRFKEERRHEIPDLVVIDGGEPQVREVGYVLVALGLAKIALVGIAKSRTERAFAVSKVSSSEERLVIPFRVDGNLAPDKEPETKVLKVGSPEFRLVTRLRDEAHRFAITLHRKRRDKVSRMSTLHRIDGLGPKRRKALLMAFPNLDAIKEASVEEIAQKAGLPLAVAQAVKEALNR
jgi:excinuclease ABC subunit C